jgi:DNA-nicking Smr family endonuclease
MLISDKKIKKQQNKIDSKIDLHGMTIAEAKKAIIDFLFIAKARNYSTILIVTGKGEYLNHQYQGKLKNSIKELLAGCGAIIKNYRQAPKHLGGEGAFIVTLRD